MGHSNVRRGRLSVFRRARGDRGSDASAICSRHESTGFLYRQRAARHAPGLTFARTLQRSTPTPPKLRQIH